eukprot:5530711-Pleurochrysis_carterae.AAC.1
MGSISVPLPPVMLSQTMHSMEKSVLCAACLAPAAPHAVQLRLAAFAESRQVLVERAKKCSENQSHGEECATPPGRPEQWPGPAGSEQLLDATDRAATRPPSDLTLGGPLTVWCSRWCGESYCSEECRAAHDAEHKLLCAGDQEEGEPLVSTA